MERARASFPARWEAGGVLVVEVVGEFDGVAATELCGLLARMTGTGQRLFVVDFGGAGRCEPGGVRQFVRTSLDAEALPDEGFLAVVASPATRPALHAEGAGRLAGGLHDTVTDAIEACWASAPEELGEPAS
ncbi:hypothetical protein ACIREE_25515 [Streptomyces sp. NPDC102467]|uniref:hypothetical protein n=1 Tax=Streptomyces sp. NPDC102467 TaxID=3366179 RepID=UPI003801668D